MIRFSFTERPLQLAFLLLLLPSLACENREEAVARKKAVEKLAAEKLAQIEREVNSEQEARLKAGQQRAAEAKSLVVKFEISKDKFSDVVSYNHKNFHNQSNIGINAGIYNTSILLNTHCHHPEWLFHESLIVKIGEQKRSYSGRQKRDPGGVGGIFENLFLEPNDSKNLARFIAESDSKTEVLVRFSGKGVKDFVLSEKERQGIMDTWLLFKTMNPDSQ